MCSAVNCFEAHLTSHEQLSPLFFISYQIAKSNDTAPYFSKTKQIPTSLDDVLMIIADKNWYNSKKVFNLSLLWMAMYGIFRRTFDFWLIDAADKWKRDKNIKYIDVYKERKSTGFVHQNMLQKASTLIQRRIRHTMRHHHRE